MVVKAQLDLELEQVGKNYLEHLSRLRQAMVCASAETEKAFNLPWQREAEEVYLKDSFVKGVNRIGRRLRGWEVQVVYGYPLTRVELMLDDEYLAMLDDINDALEEYLLKQALVTRLSAFIPVMNEISRRGLELLRTQGEDALNSVVEFMVINEMSR